MELWNIYDQYRRITDRIHERGVEMKDGDFHIVVHVWIMNEQGQFMIQKRQPWKKGWSNMWDCSAAGSAIQGDSSERAAVREAREELGIDLDIDHGERLFTVKFSCGFDDVWLVRQNIEIEELSLQEEEVADAKWASEDEIKDMIRDGEFIPYAYIDLFFETAKSPISLCKASVEDAEELLELQKEVFMPLYQKYDDHEISPVTQTMDRFLKRFELGEYYKITYEGQLAGSVFVYQKTPGLMRLHIINIREEFHNRGIAQQVMTRLELMYPEAEAWELGTILSEERNCYLYEKMGYEQYGDLKVINDKMTLVSYRKEKNIGRLKSLS